MARVGRRIKFDLVNIGADAVSTAVEFAKGNHGAAGSSKQCNDQRADQTAFFLAPIILDFILNTKRELYDEKFKNTLEMLDLE